MRKLIFLLVTIIISNMLYAQAIDTAEADSPPKSLDEIIKQLNGDTLMIYYNSSRTMVRSVCATIFRITRVDTALPGFVGRFVDFYRDSTRAVEGNYANGKKEGVFTLFYPNGHVEETGVYESNKKTGTWNYFYEDGRKKQVFEFREKEILIKEFWDSAGNKLVDFGNGNWYGYNGSDHFILCSGPVVNGRRNGIWMARIPSRNLTTNTENYLDGKMLSGKFNTAVPGSQEYKNKTEYCIIDSKPDFENAEFFRAGGCHLAADRRRREQISEKWEYAKYPGGMEELQLAILHKINDPEHIRGIVEIKIKLNEYGAMVNFIPMSSIGLEDEVIRVLKTLKRWNPTTVNGVPREWETTVRINVF